jgi:hypothetical protein
LIQAEYYHLVDSVVYFIGAIIPIYFILKSKPTYRNNRTNNPFRAQTVILAVFMFSQGIYHIAGIIGLQLISKAILEPISAAVIVLFGLVYYLTLRKIKKQEVRI